MSNSLKISSYKVGPQNINQDCKIRSSRQFSVKQSSEDTKVKFSKCVLSCFRSCSFCLFPRATAKERYKSLYSKDRNKRCQRCFVCKSMSFCPTCSKCPQCCPKFGCRRQATEILASLAHTGCESKGGLNFERGIHATLQNQTTTRSPVIKSGYAHPGKSKALFQALIELINKLVVEKVVIRSSLAFYNRLFLVPKSNHRWRPILDLSHLNLFLKPGTFKMETPETIRLSLQRGEWVTSLDFSDAYFHIPISQRSRKYLRFFLGKKAYHFTALPFGLATAPLEFTKVVNEVKLMAQTRGIRIHQYLDNWLVRAPDQGSCRLHTQTSWPFAAN